MRRGDPAVGQRAGVGTATAGVTGQHFSPAAQRAVQRRIEDVAELFLVTVDRARAVAEKIGGRAPRERARLHGRSDAGTGHRIGQARRIAGQQNGGSSETSDRPHAPADWYGAAGET